MYLKLERLLTGLIKDLFPKILSRAATTPIDIQEISYTLHHSARFRHQKGHIGFVSLWVTFPKILPFKKHMYCTIHAVRYFKGKIIL